MKVKRTILFFLLLSALIPQAWATDFGEDEEYLGQIVDDYENADNIAAMTDTINNETLDCMELDTGKFVVNYSSQDYYSNFENFPVGWTTFSGGGGTIAKSGTQVYNGSFSLKCYDPNIASYGYGYQAMFEELGDYIVRFYLWVDGGVQPDNIQLLGTYDVGVSYSINPNLDYHDGNYYLVNRYGVANWEDVSVVLAGEWIEVICFVNDTSNDVSYYVNGDFKGVFNLWGDVDPERIYVGDGSATVGKGYFYMDDLSIGRGNIKLGYLATGTYYTINVLDGDPAITILYNLTIPAGGGATMEFSTDNATWVDHNNQAGSDTLIAGYEALDLRDIYSGTTYRRVNMSSNGLDTPRMWQARFVTVTTITMDGDGLFPGLAIGIALLIIGAILALEKRR